MAAQLTFFGTWETVTSEPVVHAPSPLSPPLVPVDPRQVWLLDGPHSLRLEAELACERLDVEALRSVASKAERRHPTWTGCWHWPTWAVPDAEHIQRKRQLLQLAPALKELLRRL